EGKPYEWKDYKESREVDASFYIMRDAIASDLKVALQDVDVCILHDILYQGLHLAHNAAFRIALTQFPNMRILAFTHSKPRQHIESQYPINLMYQDMPNTTFICPTEQDLTALSTQYGVDKQHCACIPTAFDCLDGMTEEVKKILAKTDIALPEFIMVYPARAVASKGHNRLLSFAGMLKSISKSNILIICCDSGADDNFYKLMYFFAKTNNISEDELIMTSKLGFTQGVSHRSILDLFTLSNMVVLPTIYETQSLLISESASRGNLLVLNDDVLLFREVAPIFGATLFHFGDTGVPLTRKYDYIEQIQRIVDCSRNNAVLLGKLTARRLYSPNYVFQLLKKFL
ncbi:MAG: hypothetical protein RR086_05915, partial [Clostridia bacterium]